MYILISPAKTLDMDCDARGLKTSKPKFIDKETKELVGILQKQSEKDLQKLMGISDKLAKLNKQRYDDFFKQPTRPAILAFQGDVYQGLDAASLSDEDLRTAATHLGILSGLYGLLRADDAMHAYRLEMGTSLKNNNGKNLYDFWGDKVAQAVNENLRLSNSTHIVNLASAEYAKVIAGQKLDKPVLDIQFKEVKDGKEKIIGIYAKRARGLMARFIIQEKIKDAAQLQKFNVDGYQYNKTDSDESIMVFKRKH